MPDRPSGKLAGTEVMNLSTLKSLQARIRISVGPDRKLEYAIHNAFCLQRRWPIAPNYTIDPYGLGACVALQREVLPDYRREVQECLVGFQITLWVDTETFQCERHRIEEHAHLLAIFAAVIAREEAKETEKTP